MLALVVCVPVPALALSGLNVPLPSVVERVAAALVPFATAPTLEDGAELASGRIVQAPGQRTQVVLLRSGTKSAKQTVRVVRHALTTASPSSSRARTKAGTLLPKASGPSSTFGEDSMAETPASPAPSPGPTADTLGPAASPPPTNVDVKPKPRPADTRPRLVPDPGLVADVDQSVELDVKPAEPVDGVVDVKPSEPVVALLPPVRERDESPLPSDADSGK
jgi:hypothetical protein